MNIFHRVTTQSLRKNPTRTVVTIIGIILSAAMITAVTTFASSVQRFALEDAIYHQGSWQVMRQDIPYEVCQDISREDGVKSVGFVQHLGYSPLEGGGNPDKPYLYVLAPDETAREMMPIHLLAGRYPDSSAEILLPEHLSSNGGVHYEIDEKVTISLGNREIDGEILGQINPSFGVYDDDGNRVPSDEVFVPRESRTYTVVGFYNRLSYDLEDYSAPGYTALTVPDETHECTWDALWTLDDPRTAYGGAYRTNDMVLRLMGSFRYNSFAQTLASMAVIVIALIMFGSVSLIYNAFAISVSERTKQFGLLSSIGATKKQLRRMVLFEAVTVSTIGIPVGILSGIGGIGVTLYFLREKFTALGLYGQLTLHVSWVSVALAAVIALVTVLISAWIPSRRATRVTAVEAIRQTGDVKDARGREHTYKLTYRLFGLPGVLAAKHYRRSRKKYRTTVVSLFMSIVLFVSATAFTDYLTAAAGGGFQTGDYDLSYFLPIDQMKGRTPEEVLALLREEPHVTAGAYMANDRYFSASVSSAALRDGVAKELTDDPAQQETPDAAPYILSETVQRTAHMELGAGETAMDVFTQVHFLGDDEFRQLLRDNGLSEADYFDPDHPLGIAVDRCRIFDGRQERYHFVELFRDAPFTLYGEKVREEDGWNYYSAQGEGEDRVVQYINDAEEIKTVPYEEAVNRYSLSVGKALHEFPYYLAPTQEAGAVQILYPYSVWTTYVPETDGDCTFYLQTDDHNAAYENLEKTLVETGLNDDNLYDYAADAENQRNLVTIIRVFAYGFIVLISLIAAANVFNTISTNIALRRREFAMLKSIGMSGRGFDRMMNYECLLYGTRALALGLPVAALVTLFIWKSVSGSIDLPFHLPWTAMAIATAGVFAVVGVTMLYAMGKIKKDNPIDALKNENL